jgi:hypothetical protein
MIRTLAERVADVRRLVDAGRRVYDGRAAIVADIARSTGLTGEGVDLGFDSLERDPSDADLEALAIAAGEAERVHVVLSANVFVAPLRALAMARAASTRVSVRPSPREPTLTRALVEAAGDRAIALVDDRDVARVERGEIHVYGSDETIAAVRSRARTGVVVRAHGAGLGIAVVTRNADLGAAAAALARDVVPFDQRGCLSPRLAFVEGGADRGEQFASALHEELAAWDVRVPRGALVESEIAAAIVWRDALAFTGRMWRGARHDVALAPSGAPLAIPPPGRCVQVFTAASRRELAARIAPVARFVVSLGSDDPRAVDDITPPHARASPLGRMQHPALDGPVDRRALRRGVATWLREPPCSE